MTVSVFKFPFTVMTPDPQANLTSWLGLKSKIQISETIFSAVIGSVDDLRLPQPKRVHGLDLIPSSLDIARIEPQLLGVTMGVTRLRNAICKLEGYDFVLIDPPPSLGVITVNGNLNTLTVIVGSV